MRLSSTVQQVLAICEPLLVFDEKCGLFPERLAVQVLVGHVHPADAIADVSQLIQHTVRKIFFAQVSCVAFTVSALHYQSSIYVGLQTRYPMFVSFSDPATAARDYRSACRAGNYREDDRWSQCSPRHPVRRSSATRWRTRPSLSRRLSMSLKGPFQDDRERFVTGEERVVRGGVRLGRLPRG